MEIFIVYSMECHWCKNMYFKDGVDYRFIIELLLGLDFGFEDGIKYGFILGIFIGSEV